MHRFWLGCLALGVLCLGGCSKDLKIAPGSFAGPSVGVDSSGEWHEIVAALPTPGWMISLDRRQKVLDAQRVFITLRRPNPVAVYRNETVTQRMVTPVRTDGDIEVYARVLRYSDQVNAAYSLVSGR